MFIQRCKSVYTRDFDGELLWRDNRLNPINEGTNGIQVIDLLGRKLLMSDGRSFALLRERIARTADRAGAAWTTQAAALAAFWSLAAEMIDGLRDLGGERAFNDATEFLRAFECDRMAVARSDGGAGFIRETKGLASFAA